jgi:hypothetical protein
MDISILFLFLLCLLKTPSLSSSKTLDILRASSLSVEKPADALVSANGEFSAGFFPVGDNAFCFSIWFTRSSAPTVVWMANRDDPVDGKGSELSLLSDGKLILTNSVGISVWTTRKPVSASFDASKLQLQLLNTGNLVLHNSDPSVIIWQSFDSPTDTLLPQQALTRISSLVSKKSQADYSSGYYKLYFDNDNVLRLLHQGLTISSLYWPAPWFDDPGQAGRSRYNTSRDGIFNVSGYFLSSDHFEFRAADFGEVIPRRLTVDSDGNLRLYSLQVNSSRDWVVTWQALSGPCQVHGICGPNSVCSYDHASGRRCDCIPGFKMEDPTDWSFGCTPEFNISCSDDQMNESSFVQLAHVEFYGADIEAPLNRSLQGCEQECQKSCACMGFQFKFIADVGQYSCYPKYMLLNGRRTPNFDGDLYLRLPKGTSLFDNKTTSDDDESRLRCLGEVSKQVRRTYENKTVKLLLWFATAVGGLEVICVLLVLFFLFRTDKHSDPAEQGYLLTSRFRRFSFAELRKATKGFSEVVGRGAGGTVYKGVLPDQRVCAIKRLNEASQGEAEFLAEVNTIGRLNHMNLIDIWGFCAEGKHRLLVYEYMEHGSLAKNLSSNIALDWEKRFEIAVGTAKGLAYLHEECLEWVLHCDVKPQNILLYSDNYLPKVADFGLSKLLNRSELDHSSFSKMRGTRGYMAPEWLYNLPITSKVDVYSYGIVVLEMVTGKSPTGMHSSNSGGAGEYASVVKLVKEKINNVNANNTARESWIGEIIDPRMAGKYDSAKMELLVKVALQCVADDKDDRPTMNQVVEMLLRHQII